MTSHEEKREGYLAARAAELSARIEAEGFTLFWHRRATVNLLFAAQGPVCAICGRYMMRHAATIDHVEPQSRGGKNALDNFTLAHEPCNHDRADAPASTSQMAVHAKVLAALGLATASSLPEE